MGQVCGIAVAVISCVLVLYGAGRHVELMTLHKIVMTLLYTYVARVLYQLTLSLTKLSICASYLHIFKDRTSRRLTYGMIGFNILYTIPILILSIFQCRIVSNAWNPATTGGCVSSTTIIVIQAVCNIAGDILMLMFVIPRLRKLRSTTRPRTIYVNDLQFH